MAAEDGHFEELVAYIKTNRGFDFTGYKRPSLQRRIEKRMHAVGAGSYDDYRDYLEQNQEEFAGLFNTILINVTTFFRDLPAWDYLRAEIVPQIVEAAKGRDSIRVWSTGCASGEEAYTLAIAFAEAMSEADYRSRMKIYATDVDEEALTEGRHGVYQAAKLENVPLDLRERYFDRIEQRYIVRPDVRRVVIFGRHDVVQDPPISRVDLISSRNTLMYFTSDAQSRILASFHFALRDGGYLFLGKSEMMLTRGNLFQPVELKQRVFQRVPRTDGRPFAPRPIAEARWHDPNAEMLMREVGFESAAVAQLVVDPAGNLTLANLQARTLFDLAQRDVGRPLKDLDVSYKPVELRSHVDKAYSERQAINLRDVQWDLPNGELRMMDVQVAPLLAPDGEVVGVGVSFVDVTRYRQLQDAVELSKRDVETAYEELQSTVEELETTNEELQSTNEELETTNEELQSTNEELETMNEELQSTNEELETINDELNLRSDELNRSNFFLESILRSVESAVVVVDEELRVLAWNDGAFELWGLRDDEVAGQHLMNLEIGLPLERVRNALRATLSGAMPHDTVDVPATDRRGRAITVRVRTAPLLLKGGRPHGVIVLMESLGE